MCIHLLPIEGSYAEDDLVDQRLRARCAKLWMGSVLLLVERATDDDAI